MASALEDHQRRMERRRADEQAALTFVPSPVPAPERTWEPATDADIAECRPAALMLKKALGEGWTVSADAARGPYLGADGTSLGTADAISLIFRWRRFPEAMITYYWRGKRTDKGAKTWESAASLLGPLRQLNATDLGLWLTGSAPNAAPKAKTGTPLLCPCGCGDVVGTAPKKKKAA